MAVAQTCVVILLAAAVIAVPLFRRLGLARSWPSGGGLVVGPSVWLFHDPETIIHAAELGVVLFLFVIGLEMQPSRLWAMRARSLAWALPRCWWRWALSRPVGMTLAFQSARA